MRIVHCISRGEGGQSFCLQAGDDEIEVTAAKSATSTVFRGDMGRLCV